MLEIELGLVDYGYRLPVVDYLLDKESNDLKAVKNIIVSKLEGYREEGYESVILCITEMTPVVTECIAVCLERNIPIKLFHYDRNTGTYFCQVVWSEQQCNALDYLVKRNALYDLGE